MPLPINIENLIKGTTVEWERIEFKAGWNPEAVMHTMCAFANDFHNWGGGYIVIGIEEKDGKPILSPIGLSEKNIDIIQKEIVELGHKIQNNYFPIIQPYVFQDKHILILWCPAGDTRIYTAPEKLDKNQSKQQRFPYVRIGSKTMIARGENLRQLNELAARIPFDDRINYKTTINDLDLGLIQAYLQEIKSGLYAESTKMTISDLARAMNIAKGPNELLRPLNVGLLFFSRHPEDFFPRSWIEVVIHKDDTGTQFEESYFKGPIHLQLREALRFIKTTTIKEKVVKVDDRPEANRFYNFPYVALEESLVNACYHKGYDIEIPVEVQIFPDKISILSFPGPMPPIDKKELSNKRQVLSRNARNRRIGDFFKELELTEGRNTGFPKIYDAMEKNGSPKPIFETDTDRINFLTILPVHERYNEPDEQHDAPTNQSKVEVPAIKKLSSRQQKAIDYIRENGSINSKIYRELTGVSKRTATNDLRELVILQILEQTGGSKNIAYHLFGQHSGNIRATFGQHSGNIGQ
jgi:ATP-dependent DNA helicase RecG